ncbi:MAG TPA: 50S ribosomal protein L9 [Desulfobacterales bacterium]|nr:50S ribosomal protein L9 [Desulfobacterales bacterium]
MELILKTTIDNLGEEGDLVTVKPGFGRNYLIPQSLAVLANKANKARLELERDAIEARKSALRQQTEGLSKKIAGAVVTISKRVGDENKLYGSVTNSEIADKLAELGIEIDRRKITIDEPIKTVGIFNIPIKIGYQAHADIKVEIVPQTE